MKIFRNNFFLIQCVFVLISFTNSQAFGVRCGLFLSTVQQQYVLILGSSSDEHVLHVHEALIEKGVTPLILDTTLIPSKVSLSYNPKSQEWIFTTANFQFSSHQIQSIYWRNYNGIVESDFSDDYSNFIAERDNTSLIESFLASTKIKWINGLDGINLHKLKPKALTLAVEQGALIPETLISSDKKQILDFAEKWESFVVKPVLGGFHTKRISKEDITPKMLESLTQSPVTLQEEIKGTNIRVFVAGDQVRALEVKTDDIDFRTDKNVEIFEHFLPEEMIEEAKKIAQSLHLKWTGIDYRLSEDGQYYFLEANPSPMFIGFEYYSKVPLTDMLIDLLLE